MNRNTQTTYAESEGERPFDWNAFLDMAEHNGEVDYVEMEEASALANSWVTCACGNQCAALPRDEDGTPEDDLLKLLGCEFNNQLQDMLILNGSDGWKDRDRFEAHVKEARRILGKIEKRSAFLLSQMKGEPS